MFGFLTGAIAGALAMWFWGDRVSKMARDTTDQARDSVARGLGKVQAGVEGALDTAKEQVRTGLEASQDYVRSEDARTPGHYR